MTTSQLKSSGVETEPTFAYASCSHSVETVVFNTRLLCCSLVQTLLAPERFLRVLMALRVTLKGHCETGNSACVMPGEALHSHCLLPCLSSPYCV